MGSQQRGYRRDEDGVRESREHAEARVRLRLIFRQAAVGVVGVLATGATLFGAHLVADNNQVAAGLVTMFGAWAGAGIAIASLRSKMEEDDEILETIRNSMDADDQGRERTPS
ncbi:MAG TPA: hypothetical protein DCM27_08120 [Rhodospirillaceae bacterium]|nr:hypothetical protein [Rhodospirillaceae bacterium]